MSREKHEVLYLAALITPFVCVVSKRCTDDGRKGQGTLVIFAWRSWKENVGRSKEL